MCSDDLAEPARRDDAVSVGKRDDLAARLRDREVARRAGEASFGKGEEPDLREHLSHDGRRVVSRAVDDDDLTLVAQTLILQRAEAVRDGRAGVVSGHDDRDFILLHLLFRRRTRR